MQQLVLIQLLLLIFELFHIHQSLFIYFFSYIHRFHYIIIYPSKILILYLQKSLNPYHECTTSPCLDHTHNINSHFHQYIYLHNLHNHFYIHFHHNLIQFNHRNYINIILFLWRDINLYLHISCKNSVFLFYLLLLGLSSYVILTCRMLQSNVKMIHLLTNRRFYNHILQWVINIDSLVSITIFHHIEYIQMQMLHLFLQHYIFPCIYYLHV